MAALVGVWGYRRSNRLTVYHVPLYPSNRNFLNADSVLLRQYWLPIFDEYARLPSASVFHVVLVASSYRR